MDITGQILSQRWYVQVDDVVGGWILSNVDKPLSELDHTKGEHEVGAFIYREVAEHIAATHNQRLRQDRQEPSVLRNPAFREAYAEARADEG